MNTFPAQTIASPEIPATDERRNDLAEREAQWWDLWPGEPGWGTPLHEYLGFTEEQWREYAISVRRTR